MELIDTVVVATGGAPFDPVAVHAAAGADRIVAADGGLDHARAAGLIPDVLVGDLDSVSRAGLDWATANISVQRHSADKSATDTELALAWAAAMDPERVILVAGRGDRLDHAIAALGALGADALADVPVVEGWWGADHVLIARPGRPVHVAEPAGTTFSAAGPARTVPRGDDHRLALAPGRRRPRPAGRTRRVQRGARSTVPGRRHRRSRHRDHPRSSTMKSILLVAAVSPARNRRSAGRRRTPRTSRSSSTTRSRTRARTSQPWIASPKTRESTSNCWSPATPARWSPRRCSPPATRKAT